MTRSSRILAAAALLLLPSPAFATIYDIDLYSQYTYGNNDQNYPNNNYGDASCAPTSCINSFTYLQNRYGYTTLIPHIGTNNAADDASEAINNLENLMHLDENGVGDQAVLDGKKQYIKDAGLENQIAIEAQGNNLADANSPNLSSSHTTPTWQFLYNQLLAGQDVEVGFVWTGGGGGHWVTASSFHFDDVNENSIIDAGESASLDFVDPWGGSHITGTLSLGTAGAANGHMVLGYAGGAAGAALNPLNPGVANSGYIDVIIAESPVPEPASLLLLTLGALPLLLRRKNPSPLPQ